MIFLRFRANNLEAMKSSLSLFHLLKPEIICKMTISFCAKGLKSQITIDHEEGIRPIKFKFSV